jgi:predicted DNA-binding transcriptional regulator AlpA
MKVIDRTEAAKRLGMTPNALSCHVYRKNWDAIPVPIKIGGRFKWTDEQITEWIKERLAAVCTRQERPTSIKKKRGPGRPPKERSASC